MNDGMQFLDIVFFAAVAVFLVLRLRSVLGRRTGEERPPERNEPERNGADPVGNDNVVDLASARKPQARSALEPSPDSPAGAGIAAIRYADPAFAADDFLNGARAAFPMIVAAFAIGDKKTLEPLLSPEVFANFAAAIDRRQAAGETLETEVVAIRKAQIVDARLEGTLAQVSVRFVSEQVNRLKDAEGKLIEAGSDQPIDVVDEWTFRRDTRSRNPNWELVATRTPEDE